MSKTTAAARTPPAGRVVRPERNGKTKVVRTTAQRWSDKAEALFLEELAATCNVRAAAAACGFSTVAIYKRRMRWPAFAEAWALAIEQGYANLEAMLVERATDSLLPSAEAAVAEGAARGPTMSIGDAMNLLRLHRASVHGGRPQDYGWREKAPDIEDVRASILRKIEAIERADALKAKRKAGGGQADSGLAGGGEDGA
jgi:hypothetical protein